MLPFSPPRIDQKILDEVNKTLLSGWITTGPRTKTFEQKLSGYCGNPKTLGLNSATAGLEIMLRWFGVKEGDEVILPSYTYAATANVIIHCGAKPVFVDVNKHLF
jgi:dTDP-4-amino-4,6-dideoxygalactose transaminase